MRVNKVKIRIITLGIILFFILSTINNIFVVNVSSEWEKLEEDGIWYDEFKNTDSVDLINCVHNTGGNGYILLGQGNTTYEYNYLGQSTNMEIWESNATFLEGRLIKQILSYFISPNLNPGYSITNVARLENIKNLDKTNTLDTSGIKFYRDYPKPANPIQHYRFNIDQDQDLIESFTINWWYGSYDQNVVLDDIEMYLWTYGMSIPRWRIAGKVSYSVANMNDNENIADISCSFGKDEYLDYLSEDGYIDIILVGIPTGPLQQDHHATLKTDFINVSVETVHGYWSQGKITSDIIEIEEEAGWESIFWTSSRYSTQSGVTIEVLDEIGNSISGLSYVNSPIDISEIEQSKIKLRAILHSTSPDKTPRIYNWGVMWQKPNNYKDTFANDFRIEQITGLKIEDGKIKVSEFFSNWEFFGKNSANTRSYDGKTLTSVPTAYYWYSDFGFGGGFRSPVVSEGKVYVASNDRKIYAFNEIQDSAINSQKPVDNSSVLNFGVDACIAVAGDKLIVGTSEPGKKNKIYALNKNDLSAKPFWQYPPSNQTICFTAPPLIDNGRVFISSWGGGIFDTSFFSFVGSIFGKNNNLIALNLDDGSEIWDQPKKLPSGSLSAPVIGNDFVYVGCQNRYGSSLLAYDIESGDEVWNQTIGVIGRSSPIYADETIFVCAKEKNSNVNKLFAVDASNGDIFWNKTIGKTDSKTLINALKLVTSIFYKLFEGSAPITTPAFYDNTLYVVTPNGTLLALESNGDEKWSFNISSDKIFNRFSFYTASPLIVRNMIYILIGNGFVYAFNTDNSELIIKPSWTYQLNTPGEYYIESGRPKVIASPVLADGLLYISSTERTTNLTGHIYCLGSYSQNNKGNLTSTNIHVPIGHWWQSFKVNKTDTIINPIKLSILDENYNTLKTFSGYNDTSNNISDLPSNSIKLYASFEIKNLLDTQPTLDSWELTWVKEEEPPVFIYSDEDEVLYANQNLQEISIGVKDIADGNVISGLDLTTAKFRIGYIPKNSNTPKLSSWLSTESNDKTGSRVIQTVITANLSDLNFEVSSFNNITFRIKDLAGNLATSNTSDFKIDNEKPNSYILDIDNFINIYNEKVTISAGANDNISGVKEVSLIYWYKELDDDDWGSLRYYDENETQNYEWVFGELNGKTIKSGFYRISTRAKDKAGNIEDIDILTNSVTILFDNNNPTFNTQFENNYLKTELPRFELEISDDYMLESIQYRLQSETTWSNIKDGIDDKSFKIDWILAENKWASWNEGTSQYIFFKVKDFCGNEYNTTEQNSPLIEKINMNDFNIDLSDFNRWNWGDTFTITPKIPDYLNVSQVQIFYSFSKNKKNWTDYKQYDGNLTVYPYTWQFVAVEGNGYYKFYTKVTTLDGDLYTTPEQIITATILPAGLFAVLLILTTILILITATVIYKIKQKKKYQ